MRVLLRQALRTFRGDESGQSLIVIVSAMTVLLVIAAFAIDTANWMVRHHDAQVVADSAALAAAQCLANPNQPASIEVNGTTQTLTPCGSSDTQTAQQNARKVAEAYAAANGVSISDSDVSFSGKVVTVKASTSTPTVFARVTGIGSASQTAQAGAGFTSGNNQCTDPGAASCDFMFAHDEKCGSSTDGILLNQSGTAKIEGAIQSNGNLSGGTSGTPSFGTASYGPPGNGSCSNSISWNGHNPWTSPPTQASVNYPYPVDYSTDFPACVKGGTGASACASNGYPSFCTNEGVNITLIGSTQDNGDNPDYVKTGNIYCAIGQDGIPTDPSTWDGTITITLSGKDTLYDTFVGGSIDFSGSGHDVLSSCGYSVGGYQTSTCTFNGITPPVPTTTNYPIFYATGSSSTALNINVSGSQGLNGDAFTPNGGALFNMSGTKTLTSFIEANDINANISGTLQGDGPAAGSLGDPSNGSISLVQ